MSVNERELCLVDVAVAVASTLQVGPSRRCQHNISSPILRVREEVLKKIKEPLSEKLFL